MSDSKDIIVRVENLEKTYRTQIESLTILKDLNMSVARGSKCVIVGRSGSGKSTLLNIIGGLDSATCGSVTVDGIQVASMAEEELTHYRQKVLGLVFQFHYLLKDFTALENVFLPCYMAGEKKKLAIEKAKSLLRDVGLEDRMNHLPSELSGGERQRVAVARCLVNDPELILADEPTGNLDPANAALIGDLLFSMADKYKKTLILVTHDMNLASKGDVRYFIKDGKLSSADGAADAENPGENQ
ncbi:MAG: ABC transporter ATP-binding protein [Treponema sp.]|jgi:lipoprotein-releasing system ATP-binding protein|nr:ABC transporter ATP-binding protein [Treponema sp.]MBQ1725780.1 ABC transporter ATP-binding protein [Treponema sp.]MBQ4024666.1 ABC transporter ATP-binding protein [Treponema sp.]MBQ5433111.1 ABC transporter ATP-binding protein [Treponema sp.]MBQ5499510.1 ABC transporter ATP-binding protein [Treponema sp.]